MDSLPIRNDKIFDRPALPVPRPGRDRVSQLFQIGTYGKPLMEKINELIFSMKASHIYLSDT
jgi:hypothetical protein